MLASTTMNGFMTMTAAEEDLSQSEPSAFQLTRENTSKMPPRPGWTPDGKWVAQLTEEDRRANLSRACELGFVPS